MCTNHNACLCLLKVVGEWRFSLIHCDILLTLDVMMCTASILNLCAISIDRWILLLTHHSYVNLYCTHFTLCISLLSLCLLLFTGHLTHIHTHIIIIIIIFCSFLTLFIRLSKRRLVDLKTFR